MYRLLIVDNEPKIVKGLQQLFEEEQGLLELEVYRAFSAHEALECLERIKIDIILSDIRMPGMDGLELHRQVMLRWPRCRVIFLSGYDDFRYAQAALRQGGVDYILKTDGDEAIIHAVERAADDLSKQLETERWVKSAAEQFQESLPMLRKEYITALLRGENKASQARLDELGIPLLTEQKVLMVVGRVDCWRDDISLTDRTLLSYAVQNMAEELFRRKHLYSLMPEPSRFVWLLQSGTELAAGAVPEKPDALARFVQGTLESIQAACKTWLKVTISFATASDPSEWGALPAKYAELNDVLFHGLGEGVEMLLTDRYLAATGKADKSIYELLARSKLQQLLALEPEGSKEARQAFTVTYLQLKELSLHCRNEMEVLSEIYYGVGFLLISLTNRNRNGQAARDSSDYKWPSLGDHSTWEQTLAYLDNRLERWIYLREGNREENTHSIIGQLKTHIADHLDQDLSLSRLSEIVYLNPSYLSRLFKQHTGVGLLEYTTSMRMLKAQDLLSHSVLKIHEIAARVGFDSANYFGRFFKKETGMTPQEYRDRKR
ncbi:DNA-binding response regulator [Paenibacillus agaridevorans]|jgi:two-component system response regulator YesN|uniref:DNA-binding response regulator n=1 Tax=Paenibacillus agaridevorans TaxID=171404 RepID=A0A2R5F0P8_9BACL|nr:helix-turn-helix domain-containing protein [Paenibacillus agaridevorans]GBG12387.1 DNA-binding response regulator [Paenibacillus agaridevorans]